MLASSFASADSLRDDITRLGPAFGPYPETVVQFATNWIGSSRVTYSNQVAYAFAFIAGFQSGLTSPEGTSSVSGDQEAPSASGYEDGRRVALNRLKHPSVANVTLRDYGYDLLTTNGVVVFAHERSEFRPSGSREVWWFEPTVEFEKDYARCMAEYHSRQEGIPVMAVSVQGYLSPSSVPGHGHMMRYEREFVAVKWTNMNAYDNRADAGSDEPIRIRILETAPNNKSSSVSSVESSQKGR